MKKELLFISLITFLLIIGCARPKPIYPTIYTSGGSFNDKYRNIAVLPFVDAPQTPQSGQIAQGIASRIFAHYGFRVVERARLYHILSEQKLSLSGLIDDSQSLRIGKLLGANAIVVGEVGQWEIMQRHRDTVYIPFPLYGRIAPIPIQGKQWVENWVSVSLRVIDVETGELIFAGSGQYEQGLRNPPQQICDLILQSIVGKWFGSQQQSNVKIDASNKSSRNYPQNVHQEQTKSEQLRKIEELENSFPFEMIK